MCEKSVGKDADGNVLKYGDLVEIIDAKVGLPVGTKLRYVANASEFGLKRRPGKAPVLGPLVDTTIQFVPSEAIRKVKD